MPFKPELSDYEPLNKPRSSKSSSDDSDREDWAALRGLKSKHSLEEESSFSRVGNTTTFPERVKGGESATRENGTQTKAIADKDKQGPFKDRWILKRGHALSFTGLFLFTFVLYFRPYEFFPSLTWLTSIAFWLAICTLVVFIPTQLGLEGRITSRPREVNLVLLLVLAALLSIPFALDPAVAWGSFTEYLKVVVMFIVIVNVVRTEKRLRALILLALAASCFLSIGAAYDYRVGNLALDGRRIAGVIGGIFENPNDLALHLVTMVPISVGLLFATRSLLKKAAYLLCGIILVTGIIVTFSRSGFIAFVCAISFLIWKLAPRLRVVSAVLGLLAILALVGVAPSAFRSRMSTTQDESAFARLDDLKRSLFLTARHPVFGVGMGNYVIYSNRAKATHNAYTQVGAEMGVAAAIIYLMFVIAPLKPLRRIERENLNVKKKPRLHYLAIALQASLIGYMVASFFASVAYLWYVYYLVAYALCLRRIYQTAVSESPNSDVVAVVR